MNKSIRLSRWFILLGSLCLPVATFGQTSQYQGKPFHDSVYKGGPQLIPGKVYCAYYDSGGEGIAYHDTDAKNNGSGGLNPADSNTKRICEKCSAAMKQLGELPALSIHAAIKVFRCYGCDHVVSEPA